MEQTIPPTFIQLAEWVMVSKLSGYSHCVCGQGKQQEGPNNAEQNLPSTTVKILVQVPEIVGSRQENEKATHIHLLQERDPPVGKALGRVLAP